MAFRSTCTCPAPTVWTRVRKVHTMLHSITTRSRTCVQVLYTRQVDSRVTLLCNRAYCNRTRITARPELHHPSTTPSGARFQRRSIASLLDLATPIATSLRHNSLLSHARQEAIQQEHVRPGELTCNVQEFVLCRESSRQPANRRPLVFVLAPTDAYEVLEPV